MDEYVQLELLGHPGKTHGLKCRTVLYQVLVVRVQVYKEQLHIRRDYCDLGVILNDSDNCLLCQNSPIVERSMIWL